MKILLFYNVVILGGNMKILGSILILLFSSQLLAGPGKDFKVMSCTSFDGTHEISMQKQACQDPRYQAWNPNGCYQFTVVDNGQTIYDREILRDHSFRETQQGYYTLYSYDQESWVEVGIIVELSGQNRFRLTERGDSREVMVLRRKGFCELKY